jgi:Domain of unknown function (DUF4383)
VKTTRLQVLAMWTGATLLLIGIFGFIPGVTSNYSDIAFAGRGSGLELLGIFRTSILETLLYLASGIAGLVIARTHAGARRFLIGGGVGYLALWLLGLLHDGGWIPLNSADNWLHLAVGVGLLALGLAFAQAPHQNDAAITT